MSRDDHQSDLAMYLGPCADRPFLFPTAERRLARWARSGSKSARPKLVERNIRVLVRTARKVVGLGISFEKLVQEGGVGLLKAADRFDPDLGYRFPTYATWWIHQSVASVIQSRGQIIKLPKHIGEARRRLYMASKEFAATHGRDPSPFELRGISGLSGEEYERAVGAPQASRSLDPTMRWQEAGSAALADLVADPCQGDEASGLEPSLPKKVEIERATRVLSSRQRWVIRRRYGLGGDAPATHAELGKEMGITYQRAAVIEREARERLRKALRSRAMEPARYREAG